MRAVLTRVNSASVTIDGEVVGKIGRGFLILLGVGPNDTQKESRYLAEKALGLRIFEDENEKMNLGLDAVGGEVLEGSRIAVILGEEAFDGCESLAMLTFEDIPQLRVIGDGAFRGCIGLRDLILPSGVTAIGKEAFAGCTALEILTVGTSLSTVGDRAFADCTALRQMSFPTTLTSLGCGAFAGCTALTAVSFEDPYAWYMAESTSVIGGTPIDLQYADLNAERLTGEHLAYAFKRH